MKNDFDQLIGFQWDKGNPDKNPEKHDVENWECEQIFFNEPIVILDDPIHSGMEKRWVAFGKTDSGRLLTVIFTIRGNLLRVISARDMSRKERIFYEKST
ncbi:MAG: BrnT family toxin [Desulfobacterales bacterium]|jgi:hypothetical protein|nr:BrnT family toxin [Desulfobacterales bacterium]